MTSHDTPSQHHVIALPLLDNVHGGEDLVHELDALVPLLEG